MNAGKSSGSFTVRFTPTVGKMDVAINVAVGRSGADVGNEDEATWVGVGTEIFCTIGALVVET